ncbi:helix-turn-helix transcriptional regulator [Rhizobium ruizarguesonis]|uniref:helix-turn-helix transcriptional regulator n=1 Tax=Rhizobium TaxID=379 RepID=UPI00247AD66A|nr:MULTISPECIES: helix-turn-helix transcriptional regulator [Rhizobium]
MRSPLSPTLCKAARVLLGWSQAEMASKAGIGIRSLIRFENETEEPSPKMAEKLYRALVEAGLQLIAANGDDAELDGVGIRYKPKRPHNGIKVI